MSKNTKIGILLVVIGLFLLLSQLNIFSGLDFLFFLGTGFLVVYALMGARKNYGNIGFLIPGLVLLALAGFTSGGVSRHASLFFLLLSLAFWAVLVIHTLWFRGEDWGTRFWPVFPGGGLLLFSALLYADWNLRAFNWWNYIFAIVLILVGLRLLFTKAPTGRR